MIICDHACIRYIERHALDLAPGLRRIGTKGGEPVFDRPPVAAIEAARARLLGAVPTARKMRCRTNNGMPFWHFSALGVYAVVVDGPRQRCVTVLPRHTTIDGVRVYLVTPDDLDTLALHGGTTPASAMHKKKRATSGEEPNPDAARAK